MSQQTADPEEAFLAVSDGATRFSSSLFQAVAEETPGNLILSPLSVDIVLTVASAGAGGETKRQFQSVLHQPSPDSFAYTGYHKLISDLNNVKENELAVANKGFLDKKASLKPAYQELTKSYFQATAQVVDFAQAEQAANTINQWVRDNTRNKINSIVSSGDLGPMTTLVLLNAVYFKGKWQHQFDTALTRNAPFYITPNSPINVPMMHRHGRYNYGELPSLNAKFVEIPYKGQELSMLIILPNQKNGLTEVTKKLHTITLKDILNQGFVREVYLELPKFKIESSVDLNAPLQKLGLTDMFSNQANFSGITNERIAVSKVVQKAFIEVNEEGSEAAAVTGFIVSYSLPAAPVIFHVDQPFLYSIVYKNPYTAVEVFTGRLIDFPKQ